MTIGIVIGTFGNDAWEVRGRTLMESVHARVRPDRCIHVHGETLAEARNAGAQIVGTDHLIFLDADDDLDNDYVDRMRESVQKFGTDYLFQPATLGVYPDGLTDDFPYLIPKSDNIVKRNYLIIGTMCPHAAFEEVGGFAELPALEDHDLWLRMILYGCGVVTVPKAVYRVMVRPDSRNKKAAVHGKVYQRIQKEYGPFKEAYDSYTFLDRV